MIGTAKKKALPKLKGTLRAQACVLVTRDKSATGCGNLDPFPWIYTGTLETTLTNGKATCNRTRDGFAIEFRADGTVYGVFPFVGTNQNTLGCSDFDGFGERKGTYDAETGTFSLFLAGGLEPGGTFTSGPAGTVAGSFSFTFAGSQTFIPRATRCLACAPVTLP